MTERKTSPSRPKTNYSKKRRSRKKKNLFFKILDFLNTYQVFAILTSILLICNLVLIGVLIHDRKHNIPPTSIEGYVDAACAEFDYPKSIVMAIIRTESSFDPMAESGAPARGLMQITKITLEEINRRLGTSYEFSDMFDPEINVRCGVFYLSYLTDRFGEYYDTVFAAYNAGPTAVDKWLGNKDYSKDGKTLFKIPDGYDETKNYIVKVNRFWNAYKNIYN